MLLFTRNDNYNLSVLAWSLSNFAQVCYKGASVNHKVNKRASLFQEITNQIHSSYVQFVLNNELTDIIHATLEIHFEDIFWERETGSERPAAPLLLLINPPPRSKLNNVLEDI